MPSSRLRWKRFAGQAEGVIILANETTELGLEPESGGLIAFCRARHAGRIVDLLHAPQERPVVGGFRWFGCWPLVPFANRAFDGSMLTPDGPIRLPANDAEGRNAMHGFSAAACWSLVASGPDWARIAHERPPESDPYRYRAEQHVSLPPEGGFRVEIAVRNLAGRTLPYGIGLHPWFPCDPESTFRASASQAMRFGSSYRASGYGPLEPATDWNAPRKVAGAERVANFLDWSGEARIDYPSRGHAISISASDTLRRALFWAPDGRDFLCFEPQSHALGAPSEPIAAEAAPLALLAHDETLRVRLADRP
jgi:aldose 1-epimerase